MDNVPPIFLLHSLCTTWYVQVNAAIDTGKSRQ